MQVPGTGTRDASGPGDWAQHSTPRIAAMSTQIHVARRSTFHIYDVRAAEPQTPAVAQSALLTVVGYSIYDVLFPYVYRLYLDYNFLGLEPLRLLRRSRRATASHPVAVPPRPDGPRLHDGRPQPVTATLRQPRVWDSISASDNRQLSTCASALLAGPSSATPTSPRLPPPGPSERQ